MKAAQSKTKEGCCRIKVFDLNTPRTGKMGFPELQPADSFLITLFEADQSIHILVDAGKRGQAEQIIVPYLVENGITRLDYVIVTHPHDDHFGGMFDILNNEAITIDQWIYAPVPDGVVLSESGHDRNYEQWLELRGILANGHPRTKKIVELDHRDVGGKLDLTADGYIQWVALPDSAYYTPLDKVNINNVSIVFRLNYRGFTALFTGDCGVHQAEAILQSPQEEWIRDVHVLKASHHGGDESTTKEFIDRCRAKIVLIPCNVLVVNGRESFIHNLHLFSKEGAKIFRSDLHHTIELETDGQTIECYAETEQYKEKVHFSI